MSDPAYTDEFLCIWRKIPEWSNYEVSNLGQVRRAIDAPHVCSHITAPGRLLKPCTNNKGRYQSVILRGSGGRQKNIKIHRLVALVFHGEPPSPKLVAAHLDGDVANNRANNIVWITQAENISHKEKHGTMARGERVGTSKLTEEDVRAIRRSCGSQRELARQFNVSRCAIRDVKVGRCWRHVDV